jgi:hypothetical protein
VMHMAGLRPILEHYQRLLGVARDVLHAIVD